MEQQGSTAGSSNMPVLCTNNCGYYGSPATSNLCSVCFKKQQKNNHSVNFSSAKPSTALTTAAEPTHSGIISTGNVRDGIKALFSTTNTENNDTAAATSSTVSPITPAKKVPIRCRSCNKRLTICNAFKCRCGDQFCSLHRYSDKHDCTFDYKATARDAIARANPVVKADKISKI